MDEYAGKKAVVIGGTQGMGLAMVRALLGGGAKVLLTGRNEKNLEAARAELGPGAGVLRSDAASRSDIDELGEPIEKAALARFLWVSKALARYGCAALR